MVQPCIWFKEELSQFSVGQTAQILTCSIMDKPHTGVGMEAIEGLCFLASLPLAGTGQTEGGEKTQPFNRFHSRLFAWLDKCPRILLSCFRARNSGGNMCALSLAVSHHYFGLKVDCVQMIDETVNCLWGFHIGRPHRRGKERGGEGVKKCR